MTWACPTEQTSWDTGSGKYAVVLLNSFKDKNSELKSTILQSGRWSVQQIYWSYQIEESEPKL